MRFAFVELLVAVALIALIAALILPAIQRSRGQAKLIECQDHLRQIGFDLVQYANFNGGVLPETDSVDGPQLQLVRSLLLANCAGDARNYYCPAQKQASLEYTDDHFRAGVIGYYYYGALGPGANPRLSRFLRKIVSWPRRLDRSMNPKTWVMSDIWLSGVATSHDEYKKGVNYLMLDGSVSFIEETPRSAFR